MAEEGQVIKVGLAGAGIIAGVHLANLRQTADVEIAAVCDVDVGRAEHFAREYNARAYTDASEMFEREPLDALFVCVPPFARGNIVETAVERGIHVYLEKPVAIDLEIAARTAAAVEKSNAMVSVGYMWRYAAHVERAKRLLNLDGKNLILARMLNSPPGAAWSFDKRLSGGILVEFATHLLDAVRYIGGEIVEVSGAGAEVVPGQSERGIDSAALSLRFANGSIGNFATSWAYPGSLWDINITTETGQLTLNFSPDSLHGDIRGEHIEFNSEMPPGAAGFGGAGWQLAVNNFIKAVRTNDQSLIRSPFTDAARTLAVALAADEAVLKNKTILVQSA